MGMNRNILLHNVADNFCTGMVVLEQNSQVKYNTFIDTVVGNTSMKHTSADKDDIVGMVYSGILFQIQMEGAGNNTNQLIVGMPMVRHMVAGAMRRLMVEGDGKVKGSLNFTFFIINIFHGNYPTHYILGKIDG